MDIENVGTMTDFAQIAITLFEHIRDFAGRKKTRLKNAIVALQNAVNRTRCFLEDELDNKDKYKPNPELAEHWINAFKEIHPIDSDLAERLRHKSKFWTNPQKWLGEPGALELVPKLRELEDYAEGLLLKLKN